MTDPGEPAARCSPSTPSWSASSPTRPCTPTRRWPAGSAGATRSCPRSRRPRTSSRPPRVTWPPPASWPARTRRSPPRPPSWPRGRARCEDKLRELLLPARPQRRQGRDPAGQGRRGRRGVGAVRRRPAADVPALRRAAGLEDRDPRRRAVRPRRLQGRDGRGPWPGRLRRVAAGSSTRAACTGCSGCRPPSRRAASTPARPACWCCPRPRTSTSRSTRPTCASTSTARPARAGRASTPPTPRSGSPTSRPARSCRCRTRRASCRTGRPACGCCAPGCSRTPRRRRTRRRPTPGAPRSARSTARERVRTYNFPENRISDHRVGFKAYNLDQVLDGDLDDVDRGPGEGRHGRAAHR